MNKFFFFTGIISTIVGLLTLFAPDMLDKVAKYLNQFWYADAVIFAKRYFFGLLSLGIGLLFIFLYFVIL